MFVTVFHLQTWLIQSDLRGGAMHVMKGKTKARFGHPWMCSSCCESRECLTQNCMYMYETVALTNTETRQTPIQRNVSVWTALRRSLWQVIYSCRQVKHYRFICPFILLSVCSWIMPSATCFSLKDFSKQGCQSKNKNFKLKIKLN